MYQVLRNVTIQEVLQQLLSSDQISTMIKYLDKSATAMVNQGTAHGMRENHRLVCNTYNTTHNDIKRQKLRTQTHQQTWQRTWQDYVSRQLLDNVLPYGNLELLVSR